MGDHYHKVTEELFLITKGKLTVTWINATYGPGDVFKAMRVTEGDAFIFKTFVHHKLEALVDSSFITLLSEPYDQKNTDIFTDTFSDD